MISGEEEEPLNVANGLASAPEEEAGPEVDPVEAELPPAPAPPTPDPALPPAGTPKPAWTPAELAARLVKRFRDRGLNPKVESGPDGSDVIRFFKFTVDAEPPRPDELAELAKLRPYVIDHLKGNATTSTGSTPSATPPVPPAKGKPAPPVPKPVQVNVRVLVTELPGHADPAIEGDRLPGSG